jgi:copper oxidase (laccase) domain-containing protein
LCRKSAGESSFQIKVFLTFRSRLPVSHDTPNLGIEPDKIISDCINNCRPLPHWESQDNRLHRAGVTDVHADASCTYSDAARFFSFRRDGATGRMAALIWQAPR